MGVSKLTIIEALSEMRARKLTSLELVNECLRNVEKYNRRYNVFLTVADREDVLAQARQIDQTDFSLPLAGIPIAVKDLFSTSGLRTTAASKVLEAYVPKYDATVVSRLKAAGAIIIGKVNQDAWAHGSSGENSDFGATGNAYNPEYVAGGSSSGSAVAVALGMCLAATGTDTGGSIRVPAAYNNLVGLKPTYGRVSRYGVVAMASSLDSMSHVTKTVADSALFLGITAGKDPYDGTSGDLPVPDYLKKLDDKEMEGLRIGVSKEYLNVHSSTSGMDRELENRVKESLEVFAKLGAKIVGVDLSNTKPALETYYVLVPSEISSNLARYDGIRFGNDRSNFGPEAKRRIMIGTYALSSGYYDAYYKTAQKVRTLVKEDFEKAFLKVDLIFAPVAPVPPFKVGEKVDDPLSLYLIDIFTVPVNLAGLPAVAIPAGFVNALPVGAQLIGPQWSEELLLQVARKYEEKIDWHKEFPKPV